VEVFSLTFTFTVTPLVGSRKHAVASCHCEVNNQKGKKVQFIKRAVNFITLQSDITPKNKIKKRFNSQEVDLYGNP